jgi:hypothetical protein
MRNLKKLQKESRIPSQINGYCCNGRFAADAASLQLKLSCKRSVRRL